MNQPPPTSPNTSLAARLATAQVGVRDDLEVTRHLFRGEAAYVVRDPVTFSSHSFAPADYEVLVRLRANRTLGETFDDLCASGKASPEDAEHFYQFVMSLHRLGFLRLPIADDKVLYRRFQAKEQAKRQALAASLLFLRVPLWNPNAFLDRTIALAKPLFTRTAFVLWLMLIAATGYVLWSRQSDLREPLQGLLAASNLPLLWLTLIVLKTFHEFGHAYACKHFGGHVPEMGAFFILFTPCAYVDATACWGFVRTRDRVIVCLAGMYIESILAAVAALVWAATGPSLVNSAAYNAMFLAGVVTVLFNINPLMRYDGYYVLSDLLGIPNLRARSSAFLRTLLKHIFLRLPVGDAETGIRLRATLFLYGTAAALYRVTLLVAIAAVLASKMFLVGMAFAVLYLAKSVFSSARQLMNYLWHAEETAPVRVQAVALGVLVLVVLPAAAVFVPLPSRIYARGVIAAERETPVHARQAGFLSAVSVEPGAEVLTGDSFVELTNDALTEALSQAEAQVSAARTRRDALLVKEPGRARQEQERLAAAEQGLQEQRKRQDELKVVAPAAGRLVMTPRERDAGRFFAEGELLGLVAAGACRVKALLDEEDFARVRPRIGDRVEFRAALDPGRTLAGTIVEVAPAGSRAVQWSPLTQLAGGDIAVNPVTHEAAQAYFQVTVQLPQVDTLHYGTTGSVRLFGPPEPLASRMARRVSRFVDKLARE